MNGNRKHNHGSVERVLNLAQMAKRDGMPEYVRQQFQRQLDEEQMKIEQLLEIDPEVEHTPKHHLELWAEDLNKKINQWFKDQDENDDDDE
jgi:hypothetical protein